MSAGLRHGPLRLAERLAHALQAPSGNRWAVPLALAAYTVVWTLYGVIAKSSQDVHFDMGEAVAWSRELATGNPKHPPLSALVVKAWFAVFPLTDWAFYLLAISTATLGLWMAWVVAGRWLDPQKRLAGLALLTFIPFYNFQALKYNANTVLIPLWAVTTFLFLRSFETRRLNTAALAGVAAAAAVLGKYWSLTLLAGLGIAAMMDYRRRRYFGSAAPWVTAGCGALALSPHALWLITHPGPLRYAIGEHAAVGLAAVVSSDLRFVLGSIGYAAGAVGLALWLARPSRQAIFDALWPSALEQRLPVLAFFAPLMVPTLMALGVGALLVPLWAMPAFTLLPVVLLASPQVSLRADLYPALIAVAVLFPFGMLLAAPAVAVAIHLHGLQHHAAHYRLLAAAIEQAWHQTTRQPLRLIGSDTNLVNGVVFYLSDAPSTYNITDPWETPWVDAERMRRQGLAVVCALQDARCVGAERQLLARSPGARQQTLALRRRFLGLSGAAEEYLIGAVAPAPDG